MATDKNWCSVGLSVSREQKLRVQSVVKKGTVDILKLVQVLERPLFVVEQERIDATNGPLTSYTEDKDDSGVMFDSRYSPITGKIEERRIVSHAARKDWTVISTRFTRDGEE